MSHHTDVTDPGKDNNLVDTDVIVIGGGQAGIALSEHLSAAGVDHIVLEKDRLVERWRTQRWDSLVSNGPAWHDRFPGEEYPGTSPDGFASKEQIVEYFERHAKSFDIPVKTNVTVSQVLKANNAEGFIVDTSAGTFRAKQVVGATGPFVTPVIPPVVDESINLHQLHSSQYKNPEQLPEGDVLVVGAGSSGAQIAEELNHKGRGTFLSVGPHERPPRRYRGKDFSWWRGVMNVWNTSPESSDARAHVTMAVSGAWGGRTIDYRAMAHDGVRLLGTTKQVASNQLHFNDDLNTNLQMGDRDYYKFLAMADQYVEDAGLTVPEDENAWAQTPDPKDVENPVSTISADEMSIKTVIWATGYRPDFSWLNIKEALQPNGLPVHFNGISPIPGLYFVGLPWQTRRESAFIWGVWSDAKLIADRILARNRYIHL